MAQPTPDPGGTPATSTPTALPRLPDPTGEAPSRGVRQDFSARDSAQQATLGRGTQNVYFGAPGTGPEAAISIVPPIGQRSDDLPLRGRDKLLAELSAPGPRGSIPGPARRHGSMVGLSRRPQHSRSRHASSRSPSRRDRRRTGSRGRRRHHLAPPISQANRLAPCHRQRRRPAPASRRRYLGSKRPRLAPPDPRPDRHDPGNHQRRPPRKLGPLVRQAPPASPAQQR